MRVLKDKNPIPLNRLPQRRARNWLRHEINRLADDSRKLALDCRKLPQIQSNFGREFGGEINVAALGRLIAGD